MKINHLTVDEIIFIHDIIIERTGGFTGIVNYGNLDFTVDQVKATKGVYKKATVLMYQIIYRHPFLDGSKRTGFECAETFLNKNNKIITASKDEIKGFTLKISLGDVGYTEIVKWIKKYTEQVIIMIRKDVARTAIKNIEKNKKLFEEMSEM